MKSILLLAVMGGAMTFSAKAQMDSSPLKNIERTTTLRNGYRFQLFMLAYLTFRFLLDFIKPHYNLLLGLGTIQLCCLFGLLYYALKKIYDARSRRLYIL